jgi:hypothetical protein
MQPKFDTQDAKNLIALAQNAPLRNLQEASQVSDLLQRFSAWFEAASKPAPAPRAARKGTKATPDVKPEDVTA